MKIKTYSHIVARNWSVSWSLVLILSTFFWKPNLEAEVGPIVTPLGPAMRASVPYDDFAQNFKTQAQTEWCWAASISNIFAYYKHPVSQDRIVEAIYGRAGDFPAMTAENISQAINRDWIDDNGNKFRSRLTAAYDFRAGVLRINNNYIINELAKDHPLLMCNTHHCMVVTAVDYNRFGVLGVIVFDPWPQSDSTHYLPYAETVLANTGGQLTYVGALKVTDLDQ